MSEPVMIDGVVGALALHHLAGAENSSHTLLVGQANGFHGRCYRAFAQALGDIRVFALDFRGHGESDAPAELDGFAWSGMTEDLLSAVGYLGSTGIDQLHGFGHSLGGAAMIDLEREQPGAFASVFTFEPIMAPQASYDPDLPLTRSAEGRLRSFPTKEAALMRYAARPPLGLFRADVLFDYVHHGFADADDGSVTLKCWPEHEAEVYRRGAQSIHLDQAAEVESEIVVGRSGDGGFGAQVSGPIVELLPNGRVIDFPEITHFGPLQDPIGVAVVQRELIEAKTR